MTVLYLLFKAFQPGLFDSPVEVAGHVTKRGTVVAPYRSTRKKRPEPPPAPDLFAEADRRAMEEDRKKAEEAARQEKERQEREAEAAKKEVARKAQEEAEKAAKEEEDSERQKGGIEKLRAKIAELGGKEKIAKMLSANKAAGDALINKFAEVLHISREEVMAELGLKKTSAKKPTPEQATKKQELKPEPTGEDSDDPNSPNYRFRDTGYIAGSRKEDAARFIRAAGRDGRRVNPTDIDWEQIEQNPREAKELITKSNLFGSVDWEALKEGGMEPGAGFLLDRVYASIGKEPDEDSPEARKYYALGLQSARDRLETCKTAKDITAALKDMRQELEGTMLTAEQAEAIRPIEEAAHAAFKVARDAQDEINKRWNDYYRIENQLTVKRYEQRKRTDRKWKPDPDLEREIAELTAAKDAAYKEWSDYKDAHPEADSRLGSDTPLMRAARALYDRAKQMRAEYKAKNTLENPLFRAWLTLGQRFVGVLRYRSYKGSDAFGDHVATVLAGKITDWSWAEKEGKTAAPSVTKREKAFSLKVIDKYERKGGRKVTIDSTSALKQAYGLRDVQSGNWVLDDPTSAKWHVQQAAEALADLADLFQVPDHIISMNGRLALAFGARGKGNAGVGGAARAHYESVQRVINITKMGGGGCLAHEWFHGLDNLIGEMASGKPTGKEYFATESAQTLPGELGTAIRELRTAMIEGPHRHHQEYTYTSHDVKTAELNMRPRPNDYGTPAPVKIIRDAGNVHDAVQRIQDYFATSKARNVKKLEAGWTTIAVAHYGADPNGGTLKVKAGPARSFFAHEAVKLDKGTPGKYWSQPKELAARAFQAYVEDKMAAMGRQSDYLSAMADNKYYRDPFSGDQHPFPEGEERTRINAAFDKLLAVIKERRILEKAFRAMTARYLFLKAAA